MARALIAVCVCAPLLFSGCSILHDAFIKDVAEVLMLLSAGRGSVAQTSEETADNISIYEGTNDTNTVSVHVESTSLSETYHTASGVCEYTDFSYVDEPTRQERVSGTLEGTEIIDGIIMSYTFSGVLEVGGFGFTTADIYYTFKISKVTGEFTQSHGIMKTDKGDFDIPEAEALHPPLNGEASWLARFFWLD